jgi:hypothetical protein
MLFYVMSIVRLKNFVVEQNFKWGNIGNILANSLYGNIQFASNVILNGNDYLIREEDSWWSLIAKIFHIQLDKRKEGTEDREVIVKDRGTKP